MYVRVAVVCYLAVSSILHPVQAYQVSQSLVLHSVDYAESDI